MISCINREEQIRYKIHYCERRTLRTNNNKRIMFNFCIAGDCSLHSTAALLVVWCSATIIMINGMVTIKNSTDEFNSSSINDKLYETITEVYNKTYPNHQDHFDLDQKYGINLNVNENIVNNTSDIIATGFGIHSVTNFTKLNYYNSSNTSRKNMTSYNAEFKFNNETTDIGFLDAKSLFNDDISQVNNSNFSKIIESTFKYAEDQPGIIIEFQFNNSLNVTTGTQLRPPNTISVTSGTEFSLNDVDNSTFSDQPNHSDSTTSKIIKPNSSRHLDSNLFPINTAVITTELGNSEFTTDNFQKTVKTTLSVIKKLISCHLIALNRSILRYRSYFARILYLMTKRMNTQCSNCVSYIQSQINKSIDLVHNNSDVANQSYPSFQNDSHSNAIVAHNQTDNPAKASSITTSSIIVATTIIPNRKWPKVKESGEIAFENFTV
ncbi:hypothetical protein GJ496_007698 [Pomphorhynchus laevis]|nr:hypothetical protein GJ496_007698 [Pomphorhynchus laevis]